MKNGYYALLESVSIYIQDLTDITPFANSLKFQGSENNSTWSDLWVIDENVKEEWNTFVFGEDNC